MRTNLFPILRLTAFELRRFRGPIQKLALVFVTLVPLLYGAIYLSANWDPYGKLGNLPVAVVNQDVPTTYNGQQIQAGTDFVDHLLESKKFGWRLVDEAEAERGLKSGDYYLTVTVPAEFSANLVSGAGEDPRRAEIWLQRNDANGFVIGSITDKARDSITESVNASAIEAYFKAVFANLAKIRTGLIQASDGSGQLATGLDSARTGSTKLASGAKSAAAGGHQLADGAGKLATGIGTAKTGADKLASGLNTLHSGTKKLASGASQVASGVHQLETKVDPALAGAEKLLGRIGGNAQLTSAIDRLAGRVSSRSGSIPADLSQADAALDALLAAHPELASNPSVVRLKAAVASADAKSGTIASDVSKASAEVRKINAQVADGSLKKKVSAARRDLKRLDAGASAVSAGAAQVNRGTGQAATGARKLANGLGTAKSGANTLSSGARTLATGLDTLSSGATQLDAGIAKLATGAHKLHDGLADAAARMPVLTEQQSDKAAQVLANPTDVKMTVLNPAGVYGRGLAPMFFSIATWVFGISAFLVMRAYSGRALAGRAGNLRAAISSWLPIGSLATVGSLLMVGVVWAGLGLDPVHPVLLLGLTMLGAACFSGIASALRTALGTPGSAILLVWLILQLCSAGGTYPAPILPEFFAWIGQFMPMTYLIQAYRVVISGGDLQRFWSAVFVLVAYGIAGLGLCVAAIARRRRLTLTDLHPALG